MSSAPSSTVLLRGGPDTTEFLASSGYPSVIPGIRSNDYEHSLADPLGYYLRRILGLSSFLDYSDALSHGSWFHTRAELIEKSDADAQWLMEVALSARETEIIADCKECNAGHDMQREFIERESNDRDTAWAWFDASRHIVTPDGTFVDYLTNPDWTTIGREIIVEIDLHEFPDTPLIAQFDLVQYNEDLNTVRIPDYKTTRIHPEVRMISCPAEFQTWHYLTVLDLLLSRKYAWRIRSTGAGDVSTAIDFFENHPSATVSTMDHIIVQKPLIRFGQQDRDYNYASEGKRKGVTGVAILGETDTGWIVRAEHVDTKTSIEEPFHTAHEDLAVEHLHKLTGKKPEKVYFGEASRDRYLDRVSDWYVGTDEETKAERAMHCPVVISRTSMLDLHEQRQYYERVAHIHNMATRDPFPDNFLPRPSSMIDYSKKSIWAPFYVMSPSSWPSIIKQNKIIIRHRDPR